MLLLAGLLRVLVPCWKIRRLTVTVCDLVSFQWWRDLGGLIPDVAAVATGLAGLACGGGHFAFVSGVVGWDTCYEIPLEARRSVGGALRKLCIYCNILAALLRVLMLSVCHSTIQGLLLKLMLQGMKWLAKVAPDRANPTSRVPRFT